MGRWTDESLILNVPRCWGAPAVHLLDVNVRLVVTDRTHLVIRSRMYREMEDDGNSANLVACPDNINGVTS